MYNCVQIFASIFLSAGLSIFAVVVVVLSLSQLYATLRLHVALAAFQLSADGDLHLSLGTIMIDIH